MPNWFLRSGVLILPLAALTATMAVAQHADIRPSATLATGTLNLILANKNGFIIAADSRMSGEKPFQCGYKSQLHCDNSQKLFRSTPHSAFVIAGFAVGSRVGGSPLDLTVASALRKGFGLTGLPTDEQAGEVLKLMEAFLTDPLTGVAAIQDPTTPAQNLSLTATLARLNDNGVPILQQMRMTETWTPVGPLNALVPRYNSTIFREVPVTKFFPVSVGISFVADGILQGVYKSNDPAIENYNQKLKANQLDDMPLSEMRALALAILHETEKLTDYVGGEDQVGEFPAKGEVSFRLPDTLLSNKQLTARLMRWEGLSCTKSKTPPCGVAPMSFTLDSAHPMNEPFTKFFMASEFKDISVALDNNIFVADTFDGATLKWHGGPFFSYRNTFRNCVLELTRNAQVSLYPELAGCHLELKDVVELTPDTVGRSGQTLPLPPGVFGIQRDYGP
ncbi:MAG TPA: hypothetical protein VL128_16885 [Candidatus Eisenbacteria bacterium]|nr:hypothetical protein [Candidatus Eisenbacteria bacterium]